MTMPAWCGSQSHGCHQHVIARLDEILARLDAITTTQETIMTDQATEAAVAEHIETDVAEINTAVQNVSAEISALQAANPGIDWSAVNAALADLDTATQGATTVSTEVPSPAPDTADAAPPAS